jgi:hypothetical protein
MGKITLRIEVTQQGGIEDYNVYREMLDEDGDITGIMECFDPESFGKYTLDFDFGEESN